MPSAAWLSPETATLQLLFRVFLLCSVMFLTLEQLRKLMGAAPAKH